MCQNPIKSPDPVKVAYFGYRSGETALTMPESLPACLAQASIDTGNQSSTLANSALDLLTQNQ